MHCWSVYSLLCVCVCKTTQIFSCIKNSEFIRFVMFQNKHNLIFSSSEIVKTKYSYDQHNLKSLSPKCWLKQKHFRVFTRYPVWILDETLIIMTDDFRDFLQSLFTDILIAPRTKSRSVPAPIFSNSPNVISVLYITYLFMVSSVTL